MSKNVSTFISKLVVHFGEPKFDVAETDKAWAHREWLREMVHNLADFDAEVLEKAASYIVATRKHRNFPLISECKTACLEARKSLEMQKPKLAMGDPRSASEYSTDRENLARDLIRGEMGRKAAREGWIWSLYVFCTRNARLPTQAEIHGGKFGSMIENAAGVEQDVERASRGEFGPLSPRIMEYGLSVLKRRDEMRDFVLHGVLP